MLYLYPKGYTYDKAIETFKQCETLFILSFLLYLPICQILISLSNPLRRNSIKNVAVIWNLSLSLFSILGTYFTLPFLTKCIMDNGLHSFIQVANPLCDYRNIPSVSFWAMLFGFSKILELIDTFLYNLKNGKQHIFLHWYHHLFTGLYTYYLAIRGDEYNRQGIWMCGLNFFVHSFMYMYYAVMEGTTSESRLRRAVMKYSSFITTIQILQMFIVLSVMLYDWSVVGRRFDFFGFSMYLTYAILFIKLFLEKYRKEKRN